MGGISGFVGLSDRSLLEKMSYAIRHRGPYENFFIDKDVGLSSRSLDGKDGLARNEDGSIWVALDGEIYNRADLRNVLEANGHELSSVCDSELVAHLYEEYGCSCVDELRGSFAFPLWDSAKKSLLLARDRDGERSIFYGVVDGIFLFASEIKALLCYGTLEKRINVQGLKYYFTWGHVPAPDTLLAGIKKLPPSCMLIYRENEIDLRRYWNLDFSKIEYGLDEDEWCDRIYDMLTDSVRVRLREGPLGISLGGIDSSTLASIITRLTDESLKSFTISFEDERLNEPCARFVADWLGIEAYERTLYAKDLVRILPELAYSFDDLKVDVAPTLPTFLSLEMAKEQVKTIFTGDHADCVFWGWGWTVPEPWVSKMIPKIPTEKPIHPLLYLSYSIPIAIVRDATRFALRSFVKRTINLPWDMKFLHSSQYYHENELQELFGHRDPTVHFYAPFTECVEYPADDLLTKINRMRLVNKSFEVIGGWGAERLGDLSSRFSLRIGEPFRDHKLQEMAAKIPPHLQQPNEQAGKYIFKRTILRYSLLPSKVVNQRKWGFGWGLHRLVSRWFRGELEDYAEQTILGGVRRVRPILKEKAVMRYIRRGNAVQILSLLMFILWYDRFFSD